MAVSLDSIEENRQRALERAHAHRPPGGSSFCAETHKNLRARALRQLHDRHVVVTGPIVLGFILGFVTAAVTLPLAMMGIAQTMHSAMP